ncbi:MAG TPA: hypothetical protein VK002_12005 [Rubricoccaceae bacterium]|nr:hypothetical protein [Rubricoccaceae bacterium]
MSKPKLARRALPAALAVLLAFPAAGQSASQAADFLFAYGRREAAVGPRMTGMGGAAVAGLGDWTAAAANPAGLAYLQSRQAVAAGHFFHEEVEEIGPFRGEEASGLTLSALGLAAPIPVRRGALAVGGGYAERVVYPVFVGRGEEGPGWQGEVSAAGAVAVAPRLMAGLALNGIVGETAGASLAGVNGRAGLSLALDYGVRLGLTVETPTYLRVDLDEPTGEVRMTTPWRVAAGFLAGSEAVLVSADVEVVDWSQARFDADGAPGLAGANDYADAFFRTVIHSRVGAEARLGAVAFRVGAAFQPDPRFDGPVPEAVWQQYALGLGVQLHPQARLDLAFVHTRDEASSPSFVFEGAVRNALQAGVDVRF